MQEISWCLRVLIRQRTVITGAVCVCFWTHRQMSIREISLLTANSCYGFKTSKASHHTGQSPKVNTHSRDYEMKTANEGSEQGWQSYWYFISVALKPGIKKHHRFFVSSVCRWVTTYLGHVSAPKAESLTLSHECNSWSIRKSIKYCKICSSIIIENTELTRMSVRARNGISSSLVGNYRRIT